MCFFYEETNILVSGAFLKCFSIYIVNMTMTENIILKLKRAIVNHGSANLILLNDEFKMVLTLTKIDESAPKQQNHRKRQEPFCRTFYNKLFFTKMAFFAFLAHNKPLQEKACRHSF